MDLIEKLTEQLNISPEQAKEGTGVLFQKVQERLSSEDFSQIAGQIPGLGDFMSQAPKPDSADSGGLMGMLGGAASSLGLDGVGDIADLAAGFKKIGLDASQLSGFVSTVLQFVEDRLGVDARSMLEEYLK